MPPSQSKRPLAISKRTKAALAAAKTRGTRLGGRRVCVRSGGFNVSRNAAIVKSHLGGFHGVAQIFAQVAGLFAWLQLIRLHKHSTPLTSERGKRGFVSRAKIPSAYVRRCRKSTPVFTD